jgi:hypothetical protein
VDESEAEAGKAAPPAGTAKGGARRGVPG